MRQVRVTWTDATSHDEWEEYAEAAKLVTHTIVSLGFILRDSDHTLVLAMNNDSERGATSMTLAIPRGWISRIEDVTTIG